MNKTVLLAVRVFFAGFSLLTALDCLLAYLPFTYHQIHTGHLFPWLDAFVEVHPLWNLAALLAGVTLMVEPWRRGGIARWLAGGFAVFEIALAGIVTVHPVLATLENNTRSLVWTVVMLVPVAWLGAADIACYAGRVEWSEKRAGTGTAWFAAVCSGAFVTALYAAIFFLRHPAGLNRPQEATAIGWSVLAHLLLFFGIFLVIECISGVAGLFTNAAQIEFWLYHVLLAAAFATVLRMVVWPAIGLYGRSEQVVSGMLAGTLAVGNAGVALWLASGQPVADGIAAAAGPVMLGLARSWRSAAAWIAVIAVVGGAAAFRLPSLDWNYLLQKLTAAGIWVASFAAFYAIGSRRTRPRSVAWLALPLVFAGAYKGLEAAVPAGPVLEQWAGYDASFLLARQILAPAKHEDGSLFQFLSRNTNIAASVHVDPVPVNLVSPLTKSGGPLPHIFIFTIDSLRRDYLSPYNPAVQFTPSIAAFAQESTAFTNAFTRYGGTGLSEPAIWSGAMLLHKQYITPFAPMNALEKLVSTEHYQVYLSRDEILESLLTPSTAAVELDPAGSTMELDFARTLAKLQAAIEHRDPDAPPIFVYTQPQNIHISVIQREGASAPAGASYPGFYAPYASRLKRMDAAFGQFIQFLKARGLYDQSIIVLTADHGDSLGEDGRWGHAYTLFPEIVRIPLIVHLPETQRAKVAADAAGLAFSTDITPSLYYLLGHRPIQKNELFGSALFTGTAAERQRDPQAAYLLASSYAAVYGMLSDGGRKLYVADGVNYRDYLFDLTPHGDSPVALNAQFESQEDELIRRQILSINRFYRFGDGSRKVADAPGGRP